MNAVPGVTGVAEPTATSILESVLRTHPVTDEAKEGGLHPRWTVTNDNFKVPQKTKPTRPLERTTGPMVGTFPEMGQEDR